VRAKGHHIVVARIGAGMWPGGACLVMLLSYPVLGLWGSMAGLIAGILLLDIGEQLALISNQHVIYALQPQARSRLNTLFMSGMFVGGAAGSWVAGLSWRMGGWHAACTAGGMLVLTGLILHRSGTRGDAHDPSSPQA
ncbi:MAG: hypothetical protein ACN6OH_06315, partial [Bordetella trematum]